MQLCQALTSRFPELTPGFAHWSLAIALALGVAGCSTRQGEHPEMAAAQVSALDSVDQPPAVSSDTKRLEELWQKRTHDSFGSDFCLGPGDLLEISVPLEQLEHREVRVSPEETITLPLVGVMRIKGMTEQSLNDALRQRFSKYMYDPPVSLFVKQYGSRQVAVVGAVAKPGLFTLRSGSDTLMGMITKAGGMIPDAAARVIFVPSEASGGGLQRASFHSIVPAPDPDPPETTGGPVRPNARTHGEKVKSIRSGAANLVHPAAQANLSGLVLAKLHPIIISMTDPNAQTYLEIPARPGDVLVIPSAGEVTVGGWVQNPGAFKITSGMTALSAISAAGGALFSYSAEVLRTGSNGQRLSFPVDIPKVQKGQAADVPVQSGDVVMVDRSAVGAVPYAFYELFTKFGTGMMFPVP